MPWISIFNNYNLILTTNRSKFFACWLWFAYPSKNWNLHSSLLLLSDFNSMTGDKLWSKRIDALRISEHTFDYCILILKKSIQSDTLYFRIQIRICSRRNRNLKTIFTKLKSGLTITTLWKCKTKKPYCDLKWQSYALKENCSVFQWPAQSREHSITKSYLVSLTRLCRPLETQQFHCSSKL